MTVDTPVAELLFQQEDATPFNTDAMLTVKLFTGQCNPEFKSLSYKKTVARQLAVWRSAEVGRVIASIF